MQGKTAIANILKQENTEFVFCFPNNALIDAAAAAGIRPIISRMERGAVNMADGYTRINNGQRNAVCLVQAGPGIENAFPGVAQAFADSVPILMLPGHQGTKRAGTSSDFNASLNYAGVTKWAELVNRADRIPEMMRRAYTQLRVGRPRPVLLELPTDVLNGEIDESQFRYSAVPKRRSAGDPRDVANVSRTLLRARRPVIYAGQGVLYAEATAELVELAELLNAPVMTTTLGKSGFPEDHPLSLGTGGNSGTKAVGVFLRRADVVFGIGTSFQKTLASAPVPAGKVIIQSTIDEADLNGEYPLDDVIIGDAKLVLRQLIDQIKQEAGGHPRQGGDGVVREIKATKEEWLTEWMPRLTSDDVPISPYRVVWELDRGLEKANSIVTHDSGNPRDQMVPFYTATTPRGYIGWGNSTQLGSGLGLAMGAKLAAPEKTVLNLMGDTAVGMCGTDFETAARNRIGIITVIVNNGAMGGYEKNIPIAVEKYGSKFITGDYTKLAESLGCHAETVTQPNQIAPALARAIQLSATGQPVVLEVITREEPVFSQYY
jgi:acetolactate synthase-1/2/3 large subunit